MEAVFGENAQRTSGRRAFAAALLAGLACFSIALFPGGGEAKKKKAKKQQDPNIVLLMTDDQTVESLKAMPITDSKLANAGVTFDNSFASFPLCCPSRATMLTGQYVRTHGVIALPASMISVSMTPCRSGCRKRATTRPTSAST